MFSSYVVEVGEQQAGIVVLDGTGFRFFAALEKVRSLDREVYRTIGAATDAAARLLAPHGLADTPARDRRGHGSDTAADPGFVEGWKLRDDRQPGRQQVDVRGPHARSERSSG